MMDVVIKRDAVAVRHGRMQPARAFERVGDTQRAGLECDCGPDRTRRAWRRRTQDEEAGTGHRLAAFGESGDIAAVAGRLML